jgi:hypothetical protein
MLSSIPRPLGTSIYIFLQLNPSGEIKKIDTVNKFRKVEQLKSQSISTSVQLLGMESVKYSVSMTGISSNQQFL